MKTYNKKNKTTISVNNMKSFKLTQTPLGY